MAGLTKEQRAAKKLAAEQAAQNNSDQQGQQEHSGLVTMGTDVPHFPGAPTSADVHPDEVENWKAHGWRVAG